MPTRRFCYEYPRPALTADAVVFALRSGALSVLLIERLHEPFAGKLALPGGFVEMDEPAESAARRELREETGLSLSGTFHPLGFYDAPGRDPRGWTVSLAFVALAGPRTRPPRGGDDASRATWEPIATLDPANLAFDHAAILSDGLAVLDRLARQGGPLRELLPSPPTREAVAAVFAGLGRDGRAATGWLRRAGRDRPAR